MSNVAGAMPERARQILNHFVANPRAADSLEGIARWRLIEEIVNARVVETAAALEWLVSRGLLCQIPGAASPTLYRLNPAMVEQAARLLQQPPPQE